jgi:hypothetical protein
MVIAANFNLFLGLTADDSSVKNLIFASFGFFFIVLLVCEILY